MQKLTIMKEKNRSITKNKIKKKVYAGYDTSVCKDLEIGYSIYNYRLSEIIFYSNNPNINSRP